MCIFTNIYCSRIQATFGNYQQSSEMVAWTYFIKRYSQKLCKIHRRTPVLESLFTKVTAPFFKRSGMELYQKDTPTIPWIFWSIYFHKSGQAAENLFSTNLITMNFNNSFTSSKIWFLSFEVLCLHWSLT